MSKGTRYNIALSIIIAFFVTANVVWIKADTVPPMWDQAHYLESSEVLYNILANHGIIPFFSAFTETLQTKAPLITILPIPFYLFFGNTYNSALMVNLIFMVFGSYYLFRLGTLLYGEKEGLLSVFILHAFPIIIGLSREFLVEYGLMVIVITWMYYLVKADGFKNRKYAWALGVVFGLGMLMKISFILYVIAPAAYLLIINTIRNRESLKSIFINILLIIFVAVLIAVPWYAKNLKIVVDFAFSSGYQDIARNWGMGEVFSLTTIVNYWTYLVNYGISSYFFFLLLFLTLGKRFFDFKNISGPAVRNPHLLFLMIWFFVPFLIFTFGVNKDYRYSAPFLPVLALVIGSGLARISSKRYGTLLLCFLLMFPLCNYGFISFSSKPFSFNIKPFTLLNNRLAYAHPPLREQWPHEKIVAFMSKDAMRKNNDYARATLLFNHNYINCVNLNYFARKQGLHLTFETNDFFSEENIDEIVSRIRHNTDYLITKSDNLGPDFSNVKNVPVISILNQGILPFQQIVKIPLPDQTDLTIYKRTMQDIVFTGIEELRNYHIDTGKSVNFSDKMRLLDFKMEKIKDGYTFIFFWECLDAIELNYKIYVHIRDIAGNPVAYADHYPARSRYPTFYWKKGEIIKDEVDVITPLPSHFRVYSGIYEESIGVRLFVKDKPVNHPDNISGVRIY